MPNKNYNSGRAFEYRVKKYLESNGYLVFRTAGSHSSADLIAFVNPNIQISQNAIITHTGKPLLVQCKHGSAKCNAGELATLFSTAQTYNLTPIVATVNKMKRLQFQMVVQSNILGDVTL